MRIELFVRKPVDLSPSRWFAYTVRYSRGTTYALIIKFRARIFGWIKNKLST